MPYLEIEFGSGDRRRVALDKRQQVSIGGHPSNDVSISADDVQLLHCRIGWNKTDGFEVVAAGTEGVDVNGTLVQKATLSPGDVLRVGPANVVFQDEEAPPPETAEFEEHPPESDKSEQSAVSLKPLSSEFEASVPLFEIADESPAEEESDEEPPLTADEIIDDQPEERERRRRKRRSRSARRDRRKRDRKKGRSSPGTDEHKPSEANRDVQQEAEEDSKPGPFARDSEQASIGSSVENGRDAAGGPIEPSMRDRFRPRPQRPGERDPARSPFVLTLGGGALALALVGATFYFILERQSTQAKFDDAQSLMEQGKFRQAVTAFEEFLALYPRDSLADEAEIQMWISRIELQTSGASPNWSNALEELRGFITARRDEDNFEQLHEIIAKRAAVIAEGAATAAGEAYDRSLLAVSDEAGNLLAAYTSQENPPTDVLKRIEAAWRASEASILKHEALTAAIAEIDAALSQKQPMIALDTRRTLLSRYPEFVDNATLASKLDETLTIERDLVTRVDDSIEAVIEDPLADVPPALSFTFHSRARTDEVSVGRNVFGLAKDCCYAVDSVTGEPVWRRVIGWDTPFFPIPVTAAEPALLVFDTARDELTLLNRQSGALLWRQPAAGGVTGAPLVEEGQVYVPSEDGSLNKVDLESGRLISRLKFSQAVSSPAAPNDSARFFVVGEREVVYTLTKRPLECVAVSYLGHKPQSISAPILPMGALLLLAENLPGERAALHVLDSRHTDDRLRETATTVIPGHVVDRPVIWGRDLFVPSSGERISSFTVSDERGQPPLTEGPRYEAEGGERSSVYLDTGPDRRVWVASRYLRKLQLAADTIEPGRQVVNIGRASQPLQQRGQRIYVGRTRPYSAAVTLFQVDRDQLASQWQIVMGSRLLAFGDFPEDQGVVAVSESGDVYRVRSSQLSEGGFVTDRTVGLRLPEGLTAPLEAARLKDGKILVWCGDPQPQLWIINRLGQSERTLSLPGVLQAQPVQLGSRLALPFVGRIRLVEANGSDAGVQDFTLPQGTTEPPVWQQLIAIDERTLVACTKAGQLRLLRQQDAPQPYLAENGLLEVGEALDFRIGHANGKMAAAAGTELQLLDATALEPVGEATLAGTVSNDVWFAENDVFVETDRTSVHCYPAEPALVRRWSVEGLTAPLSAAPRFAPDGEAVIIALQDGTILSVDAHSGEVLATNDLGQTLADGPRHLGASFVVATADGSLIPVLSTQSSP